MELDFSKLEILDIVDREGNSLLSKEKRKMNDEDRLYMNKLIFDPTTEWIPIVYKN